MLLGILLNFFISSESNESSLLLALERVGQFSAVAEFEVPSGNSVSLVVTLTGALKASALVVSSKVFLFSLTLSLVNMFGAHTRFSLKIVINSLIAQSL